MPLLQSVSLSMFEGKYPNLEHLIVAVAEAGFIGYEFSPLGDPKTALAKARAICAET